MSSSRPYAKKKMSRHERRRHVLINKSLQLRLMATLSLALGIVTIVSLIHLYFGIWGGVLEVFGDEKLLSDLLTASRLQQYEEARLPAASLEESPSTLSFFRQAERLSERQRELFKDLLNQTNRGLIGKLAFLFVLIAVGSIFLSHKIAGPLYHLQSILERIGQGDVAVRCHLRKFDEAQSVAESLNRALEFLDRSVSELKQILREEERDPDRLRIRLREQLSKFKSGSDH